jgi:hypothetical protein
VRGKRTFEDAEVVVKGCLSERRYTDTVLGGQANMMYKVELIGIGVV